MSSYPSNIRNPFERLSNFFPRKPRKPEPGNYAISYLFYLLNRRRYSCEYISNILNVSNTNDIHTL